MFATHTSMPLTHETTKAGILGKPSYIHSIVDVIAKCVFCHDFVTDKKDMLARPVIKPSWTQNFTAPRHARATRSVPKKQEAKWPADLLSQ